MADVLAGHREVWTSTHGWAGRWHVATDEGMAACRPNPIMRRPTANRGSIVLGDLRDAAEIDPLIRCRRNGCRQRWP
jgi:hypothetical protein